MAGRRPDRDPTPPPAPRLPARPARPVVARPTAAERVVVPARQVAPPSGGVRVLTKASGPMFIDTARGTFEDQRPRPPELGKRAFEAELDRLIREFARNQENPASVSCEGCRRCVSCMFCRDRCTHCSDCRASSHLTHCSGCVGCHDCAYCVQSENCTRSNYLVRCRSCSECTYCFGCVGLAKADFHILNVKYTRSEYFRIVKSLEAELGLGRG